MASELSSRSMTKFNGTNFLIWKFQLRCLLTSHGILDVVTGVRTLSAAGNEAQRAEWIKDDATAAFFISSSMENEYVQPLLICDSAKEMWESLLAIYEQRSESSKLILIQKFHSYSMAPTDIAIQHIAKVQNMARQLLDLGETISDNTIIAKILASLSPKFNNFQAAWNSVAPDGQTLNYLQERLLQEEARISPANDRQAFVSTSRKKEKSRKHPPNKTSKRKKNSHGQGQRQGKP